MSYVYYNPNPEGKASIDCTVRAISAVTNQTWEEAYLELCTCGFLEHNMPSSGDSLDRCLSQRGFAKYFCKGCRSIDQFADNHRKGTYVLMTGTHVVAVIDGDYYDALDTGNEVPLYYWEAERRQLYASQ